MENRCLYLSQFLLLFVFILEISITTTIVIAAESAKTVLNKELQGFVDEDSGRVYTLKDLKKGDIVYA